MSQADVSHLLCNVGEYGVVVNQEGQFLVLELPRTEEFNEEKWMLPGGRLDEGNRPGEGMKREVREETGLEVEVAGPVHVALWGDNPSKYAVFTCVVWLAD